MNRFMLFCLALISGSFAKDNGIANETRLGVLYIEPYKPHPCIEKSPVINLEVLLQPLTNSIFLKLFCPRPHLGMSLSARNCTHQFYGGVTWAFNIKDWFVIEPSFGGEYHNGKRRRGNSKNHRSLGSQWLFRESISFVKYFGSYSVSIMFDHASNAGIKHPNNGLSTIGLRLGYKF